MSDNNLQGAYSPPSAPLYDQTAYPPSRPSESDTASGKADAAKDAAGQVASDAQDAAQNVAGVAKDQASQVVGEAKTQVKDLYEQATSELKEQAGVQQQKAATGLRSISDELSSMADNSEHGGVAAELVRNLSGRAGSAASWLDGRDPGSLLDEVKSFAARKPGTFIAIAAGAGILAGRLAKALAADAKSAPSPSPSESTPAAPVTPRADPPIYTQAAYADVSDTIGAPHETYPEPTFDDLLGDTDVPGHQVGDEEQR